MNEWVDAKQELPSAEGSYFALCLLGRHKGRHGYKAFRVIDFEDGAVWLGAGAIKYPTVLAWLRDPLPAVPPFYERTQADGLPPYSGFPLIPEDIGKEP